MGSVTAEHTSADLQVRRIQRRIIVSLITVQAVFSLAFAMTGPLVSLIADEVTGSPGKAGLAQAMIYCGGVVFSVPLAVLAVARGRRIGIATGYFTGAVGAVLVVFGAVVSSFTAILAGAVAIGASLAGGLQVRFAATDLASTDRAGRSMGALSWGSTIAAVLGPSLMGVLEGIGGNWLPGLSGPYLAIAVVLAISACMILFMLRPDPLALARALDKEPPAPRQPLRVMLATVLRHPNVFRAILVLALVHAAMISLMNMAAIHMQHGAASLGVIGIAISIHTAAMYLPGHLIGYLADKFGPRPILLIGLVVQVLAAATLALSPAHNAVGVAAGLLLLGLGWSFGYLGGSVLLTVSVTGPLRTMAQGTSDFAMQLASAIGALLAGVVVTAFGYSVLSIAWGIGLSLLLVSLLVAWRSRATPAAD
ncbi:MFS transporter [Nonomuraea sp. NPDC049400]|uniref:MFS transporter n=1 Tax=Nonomuraea sp. NPDC049400 TaxID=3364352 RepID=UPI00378752D2